MIRLLCLCFFVALGGTSSLPLPTTHLWNPSDLATVKQRIINKDPSLSRPLAAVVQAADAALQGGPWSVMDKKYTPPSGNKHDYMSLDKYYWPCNAPPNETARTEREKDRACDPTTGLPYVRYDGYVNPEMKLYDHDPCVNMTQAVTDLGLGYYFTGNEAYAKKAITLLTAWFVTPATRMNPNLNFGHFIPGVLNGSHGAIIDTHLWVQMLDSVELLKLSPSWTADLDKAFTSWFDQFLDWLRNSPLGKEEDEATNNHGVWYDVQAGYIALHANKLDVAQKIADAAPTYRVQKQIQPDGELPAEAVRTKSWNYFEFCTQAFVYLSIFTSSPSLSPPVDLFDTLVHTTINYQLPYIQLKKPWPFPQIVPFINNCTITPVDQCIGSYFDVLRIAANAYSNSIYETTLENIPGIDYLGNTLNLVFPKKL